jgi:hypothetical protein
MSAKVKSDFIEAAEAAGHGNREYKPAVINF